VNINEKKMVDLLLKGKEKFGYLAVKAEFEAEGTRIDELFRLMDIAGTAQVKLTVKIGGCEAIRDLLEAKQLGVDYIVAPMVETPYALSKYVQAVHKTYSEEDRHDVDFLFNMETITAFDHREDIAKIAVENSLAGIVFGRSDYSGSKGLSADQIESENVTNDILVTAELCKKNNLDLVVGGAVSNASVPSLKQINSIHLTRFETRKVIFDSRALEIPDIEEGLFNAVQFELLWLMNKRDYYSRISQEDTNRFDTLVNRWGLPK
jgi:HpcH/HpaI aldolase/citrate lyase family